MVLDAVILAETPFAPGYTDPELNNSAQERIGNTFIWTTSKYRGTQFLETEHLEVPETTLSNLLLAR